MSQPGSNQTSPPPSTVQPIPSTCNKSCQCFDHRYPSYNSSTSCPYTRQGILPGGSYMFTKEGAVYNYCTGQPIPQGALFARTSGPIYGATMGSCVPRAVQSNTLETAGSYTPYGIMGAQPRVCYL